MCKEERVFECYFLVILKSENALGVVQFYRAKPKGAKLCNKFLISEKKAEELINNAKTLLYLRKEVENNVSLEEIISA